MMMHDTSGGPPARWQRNAALFVGGQALSLFGSMLVQFAVMWHVTLQTQSGVMMTLFSVAAMLPMFFISPFGGVWADRYNRKALINIADASIALVTLLMAVVFILGYERMELLLVCVVARGLGQGIQNPAVSALIPQIVPEDKLARFNGINTSIQSVCMFAAPMASGALLSFASLETVFFLDVVTAAIGIAIVFFFVRVPAVARQGGARATGYFREMKEGFLYIRNHAFIKRFFQLMAVFMVMVAPAAMLSPLQVTRNYGADVWRLTAIELFFPAGMMLGGLLIGLWGGFKNKMHTIVAAAVMFGLLAVALGLLTNFWVYLAVIAVTGITIPFFNTPGLTMLQSKIDPAYMGRVFSVMAMINSVAMPAAMLVFGPLADAININWIFVGSGAALILLGFLALGSKTLQEAGA